MSQVRMNRAAFTEASISKQPDSFAPEKKDEMPSLSEILEFMSSE